MILPSSSSNDDWADDWAEERADEWAETLVDRGRPIVSRRTVVREIRNTTFVLGATCASFDTTYQDKWLMI